MPDVFSRQATPPELVCPFVRGGGWPELFRTRTQLPMLLLWGGNAFTKVEAPLRSTMEAVAGSLERISPNTTVVAFGCRRLVGLRRRNASLVRWEHILPDV